MLPEPREKRARIFRNGRSRAVRIPSEFVLEGEEVIIRQERDGLITIHPVAGRDLLALLATMKPIAEEDRLPPIGDEDLLPPRDVDL